MMASFSGAIGDFGCDALKDLRGQTRIDQDGRLGLPQHVDEAGSNDFAAGINRPFASRFREVADGGDSAITDADVARIPWRTGTVNDVASGYDQIERAVGGEGKSRQR